MLNVRKSLLKGRYQMGREFRETVVIYLEDCALHETLRPVGSHTY